MIRPHTLPFFCLCIALAGPVFVACGGDPGGPGEGEVDRRDDDEDGISDSFEGREQRVDTDGDGIKDYQDKDSDNDGISDKDEAGNSDISREPRDSDSDGIADFRDLDSDDNGISDTEEGTGDHDGDGIGDWADADDDDDFIDDKTELAGIFSPPLDADNDGVPNYLDPDSDGDSILDGNERNEDSDQDGLLNWEDPDSDEDGIPDAAEAGDGDLRTEPVDTDEDGIEDFLDRDSDNDGVSDSDEVAAGTSSIDQDTDRDGVTDLIELGAGTDALSADDSPLTRGDFVFVVPYKEPPMPRDDTLKFRTEIHFADMYVLMDLSGSMNDELDAIRGALTTVVEDLSCDDSGLACTGDTNCVTGYICGQGKTCIENPKTSSCIESLWTGFGWYGDPGDYTNVVSMQADPATTVANFPLSTMSASDEALHEATQCVADPTTCVTTTCAQTGTGCAGFREEAARIIVGVTDEADRCWGNSCVGPAVDAVAASLLSAQISFVGVNTDDDSSAEANLEALALASNTVDAAGEPLVFMGANEAVAPAIEGAIKSLVQDVPIRATIEGKETQDDAGDALGFVERLSANVSGGDCTAVTNLEDTNSDGYDDAFSAIKPGTSVCWDIRVRQNTKVKPTEDPQVFKLRLVVRGNGSVVDERTAYFLIPPNIPELVGPQ